MAGENLRILQTSFTSGELSPLMRMRSDLKPYFAGGRSLRNVGLYVQGGFRRRPGTVYKAVLSDPTILHEYSYTEGQDYVLGFYASNVKVFNDSGTLLATVSSAPWAAADVRQLTLTSSADTIIVTHKDFMIQKLMRTGATTFTLADFAFEVHSSGAPTYQPYYKFLQDSSTMTPSATTGSINLTCSEAIFVSGHAGTIFRYSTSAADYKEIRINSITSTTVAACTVLETLAATTAQVFWDEQTFSGVRGYPRCAAFHDQRLCLAGSTSRPDGFWASQIGAFFNFDIGAGGDAEAIDASVAAEQVGEIRHMVSSRNIQMFTNGGEIYVPQSQANPLTPSNISFISQTPYGSSQELNPMTYDGATLFLQKTGKVVREFLWQDTEQAYTSGAVSHLSSHLIKGADDGTILLGTDEAPEQYALFVNNTTGDALEGSIAVFHSVRSEDLAGWTLWTTDGKFQSVAAVGNSLFVTVERTINGSAVVWLEQFDWNITVDASITVDHSTDLVTNGAFTTDVSWTKGTGWTIDGSDSNTADCDASQTGDSDLEQASAATNGVVYRVKFTISSYVAGTLTPILNSGSGTVVSGNGTYIQNITAGSGSNLQLRAKVDFDGSVDDVSVVKVAKAFTAAHLPSTVVQVVTNSQAQFAGEFTTNGSGVATTAEYLTNADVGLNYDITVETMPVDAVIKNVGPITGQKKRISRVVLSVHGTQSVSVAGNSLILQQTNQDFTIPPSPVEGEYEFYLLGWSIDPTIVITQKEPLPLSVRGIYAEVTA